MNWSHRMEPLLHRQSPHIVTSTSVDPIHHPLPHPPTYPLHTHSHTRTHFESSEIRLKCASVFVLEMDFEWEKWLDGGIFACIKLHATWLLVQVALKVAP